MKNHKRTNLILLDAIMYGVMYFNPPPVIGLFCFFAIFVALIITDGIGKH